MDRKIVTVKSYANIAIIKYWGKFDAAKMIPATSSISLTLENMFTTTSVSFLPDSASHDEFYINGVLQDDKEHAKISTIIDQYRGQRSEYVKVETSNNMPTAAGLSSSSSGLSALVKACNELFETGLSQAELAQKAKFASGSSSRSFFGPLAAWDKDSGEVYPVQTDLKLAMIMLVLSDSKKPISSREGMKRCVETSTTFADWVKQSEQDYKDMLVYLKDNDFERVGELTERNALAMHDTNTHANPPFMIKVQTGGKLYIAGEYAVLTPGQTAVIKNIPIHMTAVVKDAKDINLFSDMFDYTVGMTPDSKYALIQQTIVTLFDYLGKSAEEIPPFSLEITGKMERDGKKFGIGSSGSVTVLTLKALSAFYELNLSADLIFKLASYTLLKLGDNGSMGDIACIAYDDLVAFTSFDRQQVAKWIGTESIQDVLDKDWGYQIEVIKPALPCEFLVGWTMQPSISKDMINLVKSAISQEFLAATEKEVQLCKQALQSGDKESVKKALQNMSDLLLGLSSAIYNDKLLALKAAEDGLDVIAKSSGSGGGDCGIAISFNREDSQELIKRWQEVGIELLDMEELA